ncbi:MAG: ABC transporter ATP-binding protein [Firmicutes bacterium]|jgi:ABC-2 type transport system ATP-binding protein|nr:ABC transporter ATP-binding protein [Bacillota bacterium]NLL87620.1 ABC transporter ATP-binding protein [Bacillota bacterium]
MRGSEIVASITVRGLTKRYGNLTAVNNISFTVEAGEIFGMLGPNGAGKTTTVEILVGLRVADAGEIKVLGFNPTTEGRQLKSSIGVQLQMPALFPRLTVEEALKLNASFYPDPFPVEQVLEWVGLRELRRVLTYKLSGGQRQRLVVGMAMISNSQILFLDEPTTGLDPQARHNLWEIIQELQQMGKTIFLTTHYMEEAQHLCDRVAIIDHGSIIVLGTPQQLIGDHFQEKAIELSAVESDDETILQQLPGVTRVQKVDSQITLYSTEVEATLRELIQLEKEQQLTVAGLAIRQASLEDVFLKLTGRSIRP